MSSRVRRWKNQCKGARRLYICCVPLSKHPGHNPQIRLYLQDTSLQTDTQACIERPPGQLRYKAMTAACSPDPREHITGRRQRSQELLRRSITTIPAVQQELIHGPIPCRRKVGYKANRQADVLF